MNGKVSVNKKPRTRRRRRRRKPLRRYTYQHFGKPFLISHSGLKWFALLITFDAKKRNSTQELKYSMGEKTVQPQMLGHKCLIMIICVVDLSLYSLTIFDLGNHLRFLHNNCICGGLFFNLFFFFRYLLLIKIQNQVSLQTKSS